MSEVKGKSSDSDSDGTSPVGLPPEIAQTPQNDGYPDFWLYRILHSGLNSARYDEYEPDRQTEQQRIESHSDDHLEEMMSWDELSNSVSRQQKVRKEIGHYWFIAV